MGLNANAMTFQQGNVRVRNASGAYQLVQPAVVQVVGPASYATGGFQVDCSSFFSSIVAVVFNRAFTTSGEAAEIQRMVMPGVAGSDTFANAKFRALISRGPAHTHTYDKTDTPTGSSNSGLGGADPHSHNLTFTSTASGTASATNFAEPSGAALNTFTYEFLVWGVPKT